MKTLQIINWLIYGPMFSDTENDHAELVYTITNLSNENAGVHILDNRYIAVSSPINDWNGYVDVEINVLDLGGKSALDTFRLTVLPVNDPPRIVGSPLPQIVDAGSPITIDLTPFESDPDNSSIELDWYVTEIIDGVLVSGERSDDDVLIFTPTANYSGSPMLQLHLTDPAGLEDTIPMFVKWRGQCSSLSLSHTGLGGDPVCNTIKLSWVFCRRVC